MASYYHNVIRLARLMLMEPDAATSRLVGSLATKRIQRWGRPTRGGDAANLPNNDQAYYKA